MRFPERSRPLYLAAALALAGCEEQPMAPALPYPASGPPAYPPGQVAQPAYPPQAYPPQPYPPAQVQPQPYRPPYPPQAQLPQQAYPPAPQPYPARPLPPQGWPPAQTAPASRPAYPPPAPPPARVVVQPPPAAPLPAPAPAPPPPAPALVDPINAVDMVYLRAKAKSVLDELTAALPPAAQAKVQGIPLTTDSAVGEVNAYAACNEKHLPQMTITDGLLQVEAYTAQLRATDEVFRTSKLDQYLQVFVKEQKPQQPIVAPPASLLDPAQQVDPRKVARQHELLEELLAFVLGHELGHHYLGHTGCANGQSGDRAPTLGDGARLMTNVIPMYNQTLEIDADSVGVDDVLAAGARRSGYHWTEEGALLTLGFFEALEPINVTTPIITFVDTHPNPAVRVIPIKLEVARFRQKGTWYQPLVPMLP